MTDWSNWTKIGLDTPYLGILDFCRASDSESVTVFSWNPVAQDTSYALWGNSDNGNPQVDWDNSESPTVASYTKYGFNYCWHINANEYELNNGGKNGDLYCAVTSPWAISSSVTTLDTVYDRTKTPATCV